MGKSNRVWIWGGLCAVALSGGPAMAQENALLGNPGGVRTDLGKYGVTFNLNDSENLLGNLSGGVKTGATMQGVTTGTLEVDTSKAFGLQGGTFHISALQIHGQPLSPSYLDNLQTANGNEAENGTRLWELWYDQKFFNNKFDIKIGQQSIDNEFMASTNSGLFVNTMAGWPLVPSADLYGGGPAYPLSSLGVRVQAPLSASTNVLAGVFDDNPGGGAFSDDAQALDRNGALFNLNTGALFIAELQYATKLNGLDGAYKLGGWYDTAFFPDQEFSGVVHHGNYSIYGVMDQTVWSSNARSLNAFARIMGAPDNQNLIDFSFNGGFTLAAPFSGRDGDTAGIDFGLGQVSSRAANMDQDSGLPKRSTEELIELTFQAQVTPSLILQPDMQYIINPGAGVQDPNNAAKNLSNEFVAGIRAIVTF